MLYETIRGRFHLKGGFVGFNFKNTITLLNFITNFDHTADNGSFLHCLAKLW